MASNDFPNEEEIPQCAVSTKNHGYSYLGSEKCCSCELLARVTEVNCDRSTAALRSLNVHHHLVRFT
jgi:hypothetical protein